MALLLMVGAVAACAPASRSLDHHLKLPGPRALEFWNSKTTPDLLFDESGFYATLTESGFPVLKIRRQAPWENIGDSRLILVVPAASMTEFSSAEVQALLASVDRGALLVTDGNSPTLLDALGVELSTPEPTRVLNSRIIPQLPMIWKATVSVAGFSAFPPGSEWVVRKSSEGAPVLLSVPHGKGRVLLFSALYSPDSAQGWTRFPQLPGLLVKWNPPLFTDHRAEAYFDSGYRWTDDPEKLAESWRRSGIRTVYAAAWDAFAESPYDYGALIKAAHRNGILVYAWFQWPYVGKTFWDQHPEWREKTALLEDAKLDFRLSMNFQNEACRARIYRDAENFLDQYAWDGINLPEFTVTGLYPDTFNGPLLPKVWAPFNQETRDEFAREYGFDPLQLVHPEAAHYWKKDPAGLKHYYQYRRDLNVRLIRDILSHFTQWDRAKQKNWEIEVTELDGLQFPEIFDHLGIDMDRIVRLTDAFGATFQIEDPSSEWNKDPERYASLAAVYRRKLPADRLLIDINVIRMDPAGLPKYPTPQVTGSEFLSLWHQASRLLPRVAYYCEWTVFPEDWSLLPYAMADVRMIASPSGVVVEAAHAATFTRPSEWTGSVEVDGRSWPAQADREVLVPQGRHSLTATSTAPPGRQRLLYVSGELLGAAFIHDGISLSYESPSRCLMIVKEPAASVMVDGRAVACDFQPATSGYYFFGPRGRHHLTLRDQAP